MTKNYTTATEKPEKGPLQCLLEVLAKPENQRVWFRNDEDLLSLITVRC